VSVEQVDLVSVPTRDGERAVALDSNGPGLPQSGLTGGEVETPSVTVSFWSPERDGEELVPNVAGVAVRAADVEAARREREANGVEFLGDTCDSRFCDMSVFGAPEGNTVILHRRDAPRG
jgi:hypothetical protein